MLIVAGEALVDLVPREGEKDVYEASLGGSPYNVAIGLGRLNNVVAYAARLSQDSYGDRFVAGLKHSGVDLSFVERSREPSALAFVTPGTAASGPRYSFYLRGTSYDGAPPFPKVWPARISHLHVGSIAAMEGISGEATATAMQAAKGNISTSFDPNIRPLIIPPRADVLPVVEARVRLSTYVKASEEDLAWLYPGRSAAESAKAWATLGPKLVVLTRGAMGAEAWFGKHHVFAPVHKAPVVDTIGAGDSFMSALLTAIVADAALRPNPPDPHEEQVRGWLGFACKAAAFTCTRQGADPPTMAELDKFAG